MSDIQPVELMQVVGSPGSLKRWIDIGMRYGFIHKPHLLGKPLSPRFGIVSVSWSKNIAAYIRPGMCYQISQPLPIHFAYCTQLYSVGRLSAFETASCFSHCPALSQHMKLLLSGNWYKGLHCTGTAFQRAHRLAHSPDTNHFFKSPLVKSITLGSECEAGGSKLIAILLLVLPLTSTNSNDS